MQITAPILYWSSIKLWRSLIQKLCTVLDQQISKKSLQSWAGGAHEKLKSLGHLQFRKEETSTDMTEVFKIMDKVERVDKQNFFLFLTKY